MTLRTAYIIWMVLILILFLLLCGFSNQWKHHIPLENLNVSETKYLYEEEVAKESGIVIGTALYSIDLDSIRQKLLKNPYLIDVQLNKQINGTIDIKVYERDIHASIFVDELYYLSDDARVLPKLKLKTIPNVPVISGVKFEKEKIKVGAFLDDKNILTALRILDSARNIDEDFYSLISELTINNNNDFVLLTNDYAVPIIVGKENFVEKLELLSFFWKQFVIKFGSENLKYVDARFEDQLVVKWKDNINRNIL